MLNMFLLQLEATADNQISFTMQREGDVEGNSLIPQRKVVEYMETGNETSEYKVGTTSVWSVTVGKVQC